MDFEIVPGLDPAVADALTAFLANSAFPVGQVAEPRSGGWHDAALAEGVDREPDPSAGYAPWPRSSRGAERA